jgi:hypothetical protein
MQQLSMNTLYLLNSLVYSPSIHIGTSFNLFVRSRTDPSTWTCVNLEVLDADYDDGKDVSLN